MAHSKRAFSTNSEDPDEGTAMSPDDSFHKKQRTMESANRNKPRLTTPASLLSGMERHNLRLLEQASGEHSLGEASSHI
jgi:hypothetical protein